MAIAAHPLNLLSKSKLFSTVYNAKARSWWQTITWCGYSLLGGLFPSLASVFLTLLHKRPLILNDFIGHGEFALYATAFLAVVLHQVIRNIRDSSPVLSLGTVFVAVFGLLVSAVLYAGVQDQQQISYPVLETTSIVLLLASVMLSAMVTLVDMELNDVDLADSGREAGVKLNLEFEREHPSPAAQVADISTRSSQLDEDSDEHLSELFTASADKQAPREARCDQ